VEILITGSKVIVSDEEIINDGYVFIRNGLIEDFGPQPPPEDYTYATLVLGGNGRIIAPGLTAVASLISYPFRFLRLSLKKRIELLKSLSASEAAFLSLAAVYELHMKGVTSIVAEGLDYEYLEKLRELAGGRYGLAYPSCEGKPPSPPEWSLGNLIISDSTCKGSESDIEGSDDRWVSRGGRDVLAFFNKFDLCGEGNVYEKSSEIRRLLGMDKLMLKKGSLAEIVVYDVRRPPAMFLDMALDLSLIKKMFSFGARVESLLVGEDVLIDGGEHLYIVEKHFNELRKITSKIYQKLQSH
jgi:hypothetical protein